DRRLGKLLDFAAGVTDGKRRAAACAMTMRIGAAYERIERFEPMRQAALGELVERAVDLQRRPQSVVAQLVEDVIGRQRRRRMRQGAEDQFLVASQVIGPDVIVTYVRMSHFLTLLSRHCGDQ